MIFWSKATGRVNVLQQGVFRAFCYNVKKPENNIIAFSMRMKIRGTCVAEV